MGFIFRKSYSYLQNHFSLLIFFHLLIIFKARAQTLENQKASNNSVSAIFVFGDSTSDPGNNNYITTPFKSNFPPYGTDFTNQTATGRFTNGLLANDFIARYVGVKDYVPPYLDPSLSMDELMSGVSFASAGSGFDPLTPRISNVISMSKQLEYFKEYQTRLEVAVGKKRAKHVISNALFLVSAGTNDFIVNYYTVPIRRKSYDVHGYMDFLMKQVHQFMKGLWDEGARRIGVVGLTPMGCLPIVITLYSYSPIQNRTCVEDLSTVAREFNIRLQSELNSMQSGLAHSGSRITYLDTYTLIADMTMGHKFDFDEVSRGCCGTGLLEASFICNRNVVVCGDVSKYVFWDSIHPTERAYYLASKSFQPAIDSIIKD